MFEHTKEYCTEKLIPVTYQEALKRISNNINLFIVTEEVLSNYSILEIIPLYSTIVDYDELTIRVSGAITETGYLSPIEVDGYTDCFLLRDVENDITGDKEYDYKELEKFDIYSAITPDDVRRGIKEIAQKLKESKGDVIDEI